MGFSHTPKERQAWEAGSEPQPRGPAGRCWSGGRRCLLPGVVALQGRSGNPLSVRQTPSFLGPRRGLEDRAGQRPCSLLSPGPGQPWEDRQGGRVTRTAACQKGLLER